MRGIENTGENFQWDIQVFVRVSAFPSTSNGVLSKREERANGWVAMAVLKGHKPSRYSIQHNEFVLGRVDVEKTRSGSDNLTKAE